MARILIVDDQKSVLLTLEGILTKEQHTVVSCANSTDALDFLTRESFDLLVTDAIMPGGSTGYALARTVRSSERWANMPIIMVTGKREREDVKRGLESGADDYIVKPIDPDILTAKVSSLLSRTTKKQTFAEASVRAKADWSTKTEVTAVSEMGVTLQSNFPAPVGAKIRLTSALFQEIGLSEPLVRIATCDLLPGVEPLYRIQAHFIGLNEKDLQPLRLWIRSRC
jgi:DNA-binding response OmpR family regulator